MVSTADRTRNVQDHPTYDPTTADTRKSIGWWKTQTKPRCARLNSRSDKERDEEGRARSQAREEGARQAEKQEEETGELDRRSFRSEKTAFSTGEQSAEGRGEEQRS